MSNWSVVFDSVLFKYVQDYARARGDAMSRTQILQDCQGEIVGSPLCEEVAVEFPSSLCSVSKFISTMAATLDEL